MILLDTSGLLAAWDQTEARQAGALSSLQAAQPPRLLSPFVLAELDYLVMRKGGEGAQDAILEEVASGAYRLAHFDATSVAEARDVIFQYRDLHIGLADASIVVLARRYDLHDVLTLDERHFRVLQGPRGPFRLLPADA